MEFLDLVKIGSRVKININLSKDRLNNKTIDAIKTSPICRVKDFRLTDGKGIGVVTELSNGQVEWFFENEIEILDENGQIIQRVDKPENRLFLVKDFLENINYKPKNKLKDLANPLNFLSWLIYSLKDIF
tara:strand:+ start:112 stop:501 length:390 start_codon:yes stop_codon:yes gene_type:complete